MARVNLPHPLSMFHQAHTLLPLIEFILDMDAWVKSSYLWVHSLSHFRCIYLPFPLLPYSITYFTSPQITGAASGQQLGRNEVAARRQLGPLPMVLTSKGNKKPRLETNQLLILSTRMVSVLSWSFFFHVTKWELVGLGGEVMDWPQELAIFRRNRSRPSYSASKC